MPKLEDTGRIKSLLDDDIREQVFGRITEQTVDNELRYYALIDHAHVTMLKQQEIVDEIRANALLAEIARLFNNEFSDLLNLPTQRGTYLCYESFLNEKLGAEIGGLLQTGRSRNDLNATVFKMRLRERMDRTLQKLQVLLLALHSRGKSETKVLFPAFTHYQTAFTSTLGHYLTGIESHLLRDSQMLLSSLSHLSTCPLGACAGGGTTIPINRDTTSSLLGFSRPVRHSIDAVASRDSCLHILSALASLSTTMSRFAADLVFWSSNETALLELPDSLVGSSSNMPQKRNPFLLEIVKGRSAAIVAAWSATATAMQWNAFSNSVTISSEATRPIWQALDDADFIFSLMEKVISGFRVNRHTALKTMELGMVDAVYVAEQLVMKDGVVFREAHHQVGKQVTDAVRNGVSLRDQYFSSSVSAEQWFQNIADKNFFGGGCGEAIDLDDELLSFNQQHQFWLATWREATQSLTQAVKIAH